MVMSTMELYDTSTSISACARCEPPRPRSVPNTASASQSGTQRNGYRARSRDTRVGIVQLQVPKLRQGIFPHAPPLSASPTPLESVKAFSAVLLARSTT